MQVRRDGGGRSIRGPHPSPFQDQGPFDGLVKRIPAGLENNAEKGQDISEHWRETRLQGDFMRARSKFFFRWRKQLEVKWDVLIVLGLGAVQGVISHPGRGGSWSEMC